VIYLDHNATTPLHPKVFEAMVPYLRQHWGNPSSQYGFGLEARLALQQARQQIAEMLGCQPGELVFCSSGTEADNLALRGAARAHRSRGDHLVTTMIEHHAVLNTCQALQQEGFRVTWLPVTPDGVVDREALRQSLDEPTILLSVMHANNETGVVQPVEEIAALAAGRGILFHTDAVQSTGKLPGRVADLGAQLVTFSGHKFYGPKGAAALYVRDGTELTPILTGGWQERGLRAGTENVAAAVGLAKALELALGDLSQAIGAALTALYLACPPGPLSRAAH